MNQDALKKLENRIEEVHDEIYSATNYDGFSYQYFASETHNTMLDLINKVDNLRKDLDMLSIPSSIDELDDVDEMKEKLKEEIINEILDRLKD